MSWKGRKLTNLYVDIDGTVSDAPEDVDVGVMEELANSAEGVAQKTESEMTLVFGLTSVGEKDPQLVVRGSYGTLHKEFDVIAAGILAEVARNLPGIVRKVIMGKMAKMLVDQNPGMWKTILGEAIGGEN